MSLIPKDSATITMHDFLELMKIACQVQDSIEGKNSKTNKSIDYNQLASNEMINNVLMRAKKAKASDECAETVNTDEKNTTDLLGSPSKKQSKVGGSPEKSMPRRRSITNSKITKFKVESQDFKRLDPALNDKLDEIINEGILDSVLPFVHPPNPTAASLQVAGQGAKAKTLQKKDASTNNTLLGFGGSRQDRRKSSGSGSTPSTE